MSLDKVFDAWFEIHHPKPWDNDGDADKEDVDAWWYKKSLCKEAFKSGFVTGRQNPLKLSSVNSSSELTCSSCGHSATFEYKGEIKFHKCSGQNNADVRTLFLGSYQDDFAP